MTKDPFHITKAEQATLSPEQLRALDIRSQNKMSPHFERALKFAQSQQNGPPPIHDWTLSQLHALAFELQQTHDLAIHQASMIAVSWSREANGGSGQGGEGYANLAEAINKLKVDK